MADQMVATRHPRLEALTLLFNLERQHLKLEALAAAGEAYVCCR